MEDGELYQNIKDEKVSKYVPFDNETLAIVKEFMKKYKKENFRESITDLVYLGLANLGYADKEKVIERFLVDKELPIIDFPNVKPPKEMIYDIIKTLSQKSLNTNAQTHEILHKARKEGISNEKVTEILNGLKRVGKIYEPKEDCFKVTEY